MADLSQLLTISEFEDAASHALLPMARDYYNGGAMDSRTLRRNIRAYDKWDIWPRVLRDVSRIDTSCPQPFKTPNLERASFPLGVAPAAMQKMAHPEGEEATARACGRRGWPLGLSSFSTTSLEDVKQHADLAGEGRQVGCVLQMYLFDDRETSLNLIRRAEAAGYSAIVLTVDTPYFGRRLTEIRNKFKVPPHLRMANFSESLGVKTGSQHRTEALTNGNGVPTSIDKTETRVPANKNDASLTFDVIPYLKAHTRIPVFLKGILHPLDAVQAVDLGADGIIVSNHGGRQLDYAPPTLDVLPAIVKAVNGRVPVHFDGGVRRGSDVFKALCLGADFVWVGRPVLWGLAAGGQEGVERVLEILETELRDCMGLAGCRSIRELKDGAEQWVKMADSECVCDGRSVQARSRL